MRSDSLTLSSFLSIFDRIASRCREVGWWAFCSQPLALWFCQYRPAPWHLRRHCHDYLCSEMLLATALSLGLGFVKKVFDYDQRCLVWRTRPSCCDGLLVYDYSVIHPVLLRLQSVSKWQWYLIIACLLKAWHSECSYLSFHWWSDLSAHGSRLMISVSVQRRDLEMCRQWRAAGHSWCSYQQRWTSSKAERCF